MTGDEFVETLRADYRENQKKWESRSCGRKIYDSLKSKVKRLYWRFVDA